MTRERRLEARFSRLVHDAVKLAREKGCADPHVYFECDSGLLVVDGDPHPDDRPKLGASDRVVVSLRWPYPGVPLDSGAW